MGSNPASVSADAMKKTYNNIAKPEDYKAMNLTQTPAYEAAKNIYGGALENYSSAAMNNAVQQGMENVYGTQNTYGAIGAGGSGAAQAAAYRGMATPVAAAQQQIAGLSAEQAQQLANTYTGVVAPTYAPQTSAGEVQMMNSLMKQGS